MTEPASPRPETVAEVAARLHRIFCQSSRWAEDCRAQDGGAHARRAWRPMVRAALSGPEPAEALHDSTCDAHLDPNHGCPDRTTHVKVFAELIREAEDR